MDKKIIIGLIGSILVVIILGVVAISLPEQTSVNNLEASANAKAVINEVKYDWGEIGISDGNVEKVFDIKNEGTESLKLYGITTSCMCTTAQLNLDEKSSPIFGMHDNSSYVLEVPPGKTVKLKVVFDPMYHGPSGVGPITRQIIVKTNDINNPEINVVLTANVVR